MSTPAWTGAPGHAPFEVHSVHFDFPGGEAIKLRDPVSDQFVGANPEWVAAPPRSEPAAYVRDTRASLRVVFRGHPATNGTYSVGAGGAPVQIDERWVDLIFDPATGRSNPVVLPTRNRLPNHIGVHTARLDWHVRRPADSGRCLLGTTTHRIWTTWRAMQPCPNERLHDWVYKPLMGWTCEWAAGQDDEKDICDAIIRNLPASQLLYGIRGYSVREMLLQGGGMCSGWYQTFQQMAHCQGVFVHRRCFAVDWREAGNGEVQWCAIVIKRGGLNQPHPTPLEAEFHDNDTEFPISSPVVLHTRRERRYRFWGHPTDTKQFGDGHCVNFLEHKGSLYLYDASFGLGPVKIDPPLPPHDFTIWGGVQLSSFKAQYLDGTVDYMLGSLYNGGVLHRSDQGSGSNGMTVRTALIPEMVRGEAGLTFYWGDE
jgi:hypothetical protein